jgi:nitrogen-specific signal transduction histidine kinase/CheY-like chemotaxis protein
LRDVTQEREIQRQIQQQERLAAVGQLAAGIAHDFNNIMAVIILYAQMIARQNNLTPYIKEKLITIREQGQRAADLIQQILDFSRQSVLDQQPLDVIPFFNEMVKLFRRTLRENIDIQLRYEQGNERIFVDPSRIQQVLMNLGVNARDAMPDGGKLTISINQIELAAKEAPPVQGMMPGSWVVIDIQDTGSGMPQETISRIFEPFFSTKEIGSGTGLGLAQVYGIMKQHSGYLKVQSEVGVGTTFSLYFPSYSPEEINLIRQENQDLNMGQGQIILLVEDNLGTRKVLGDSLELLNYQVVEADNGRVALNILMQQQIPIDLIISDAVMPEMGGIALHRALREGNIDIPMVILTGHPMTNELDSLRAQGLSGWLLKPPTLESLADLLASVLQK